VARRRKGSRIYYRERGGETRAYADFRDYRDVGGDREALIPPGESLATTDSVIAEKLVADRLKELQEHRRNRSLLGVERQASLAAFAEHHLIEKARSGNFSEDWLAQTQYQLEAAVEFFGADRELAAIRTPDVQRYLAHLRTRPNSRGGTVSAGTVRHYLNSLSNLFRRAQSEGYVPPGFNPVSALIDKPVAKRLEARWLEVPEAALLLESARTCRARTEDGGIPFAHPLIGTFLLTGGRTSEVLGLEVDDVSFDRKTVTFRPNAWRRLKTSTSYRTVLLWPQLEEILRTYVFDRSAPLGSLLFPSPKASGEEMLTDFRKTLDAVAARAGWKAGEIRSKMFRHSYCAARLQTLDRGAPVSEYTVAKELGHGGRAMVERVYGHLGQVRHRSEVVEFRVEQHRDVLGERLNALRAS
jgi:integrase